MKKVIIESHIPHIPDLPAESFDIRRLPPEEITPETVADADALIVRTRTRCDAALLDRSAVSFIATATIGTDHIDIPYCRSRGISVVSAPGCNAPAVAQYVFASILRIIPRHLLIDKTLGIVGVGHVGSIVAAWAPQLGLRTLLCDPPRADRENDRSFVGLDRIVSESDIITFHVPDTVAGPYPTRGIAGSDFFAALKKRPLLINSARGPITDTASLISALDNRQISDAVIDCWENEPAISRTLLDKATIATPHIAGYSLDGKIRATTAAVNALCRHFGVDFEMKPDVPPGAARRISADGIISSYDPTTDTRALKSRPEEFEQLRNRYALRPEVPDETV